MLPMAGGDLERREIRKESLRGNLKRGERISERSERSFPSLVVLSQESRPAPGENYRRKKDTERMTKIIYTPGLRGEVSFVYHTA